MWESEPMVVVNTPLVETEAVLTTSKISSSTTSPVTSRKVVTQKKVVKVSVDPKNINTVVYTEDGFEPRELKVPRGTPVKFVNKTDTSMRIFAEKDATHPFSDLTQPKSLGLNGEYVFNFVYAGTWEYYNSFTPDDTGSIIVY